MAASIEVGRELVLAFDHGEGKGMHTPPRFPVPARRRFAPAWLAAFALAGALIILFLPRTERKTAPSTA